MKYIVMECFPSHAILLDEEGRFIKAKNLDYEVGQKVKNPVLLMEKPTSERKKRRWIMSGAAAAVAACFIAVFGINYYNDYMTTYSVIYMNINPAVSIDLNHDGNVVGLDGENADGDTLIEGYDYHGKTRTEIADDLVDRAIDMGFLSEGGTVSFSIDSPEEAMFREYGTELRTEVNHHLENVMNVNVEVVKYGNEAQEEKEPSETTEPQTETQTQQTQSQTKPQTESQQTGGTKPQTGSGTQTPVTPPTSGDSGYGNSGYSDQDNSGYDSGNSGYSDQGNSGYDSGNSGYDD